MEQNKDQRYDRQLRLWGDHGQAALENAHVVLLNASITGTEILKGLVLPGVGQFTVVDCTKTTEEDVHGNFFLDHGSVGRYRCEVAVQLLQELNPTVKVNAIAKSVRDFAADADFSAISLVVASEVNERDLLAVSERLWAARVPLVIARSYGLVGVVRLVHPEHNVEDAHEENPVPDLRLSRPFPELRAFIESIDLAVLDHQKHSHMPYAVLLFKALQKWNEQEKSAMPQDYAERKRFKQILNDMQMPGGFIFLRFFGFADVSFFWALFRNVCSYSSVVQATKSLESALESSYCVDWMPKDFSRYDMISGYIYLIFFKFFVLEIYLFQFRHIY